MSLGARAPIKGGVKGSHQHQQSTSKQNHVDKGGKSTDKSKMAADKGKTKETSKPQATIEQLRMASMIDRKGEDSEVRHMVLELIEMTRKSEEEVCSALHDADNDMVQACNILLEDSQKIQSEWQTNEKKKKKPPAVSATGNGDHDPGQQLGAGPGGRGAGGRGRRGGGPGGRGARPRRGQGFRNTPRQPRGWPGGDTRGGSNSGGNQGGSNEFPAAEDWDNDDWSGSLSETKVFTPSVQPAPVVPDNNELQHDNSWSSDPVSESLTITSHSYHNSAVHQQVSQEDWASDPVVSNEPTMPSHSYHNSTNIHQQQTQPSVMNAEAHPHIPHQPMGMSGTLTAAQSQYLSQLTQQAHLTQQTHMTQQAHLVQQTQQAHLAQQTHMTQQAHLSNQNVYGSYGGYEQQRKQRARVPPPSKIPSTAVEMPDQEEMGSGLLDVQFGALELETVVDTHQTPTPANEVPTHDGYSAPTNNMMNENLSTSSAPTELHAPATNTVLESSLSTSMKALSVNATSYPAYTKPQQSTTSGYVAPAIPPYTNLYQPQVTQVTQHQQQQSQSQHQQAQSQNQQQQVQAQQQAQQPQSQQQVVNNAAAAAAAAVAANNPASLAAQTSNINSAYQYTQPLNSYQSSAAYGGVYTPPYTYAQHKMPKESLPQTNQFDNSSAVTSSASSLASTSTTQASSTTKSSSSKSTVANAQYTVPAPAFYTQQQGQAAVAGAPYPPYEDHLMRSATLPHHMTGYYEVGYGRDATFGLTGERFGRADAASPQQVLPPGYAYFYQPPPTTYQYSVYPQYGGGVGGVAAAGAGTTANKYGATPAAAAYEPPAEYKPQPYPPAAKPQAGEYKPLPKGNTYEKAGAFHTAQPPQPQIYTQSSLYIPHHHHHHQMDVRVNSSHRRENSSGGGRSGGGSKPAPKPTGYSQSYWTPN